MELYANKFKHVCCCIIKSPISTTDKVERFLAGLQEDVRDKVLLDSKGYEGPWEDLKCLMHYVVTIHATCAQAAKGREDTKPWFDTMQP